VSSSWATYTLDEIAEIQGGGTPSRKQTAFFGGEIPWVTPSDLPSVGHISMLDRTKETLTAEGLSKSSAKLVSPGSVLYSTRATIGKIAINEQPCATNQGFASLTPRKEIVDPWFLAYLLRRYTSEITELAGKTTFLEVPRKRLRSFRVRIPRLEEQRRIVARIKECMARVDEIEALRGESVAESEALLPSMLNEVFVGLFQKYARVEIGEVAEETRYGTSRKCNTNADGMPILRIPNVAGGFVNYENLKHCPLDEKERQRVKLNAGDLLFVRTNGSKNLVGRCAVYEGQVAADFGFASYLIRVRLKKTRVLPHFLAFFLNSTHGRQEIDKRRRTSAGQFNINSENLRSIELPLPPIEIQESIVSELRERQREINVLQHEVQEAKLHEDQLRESILRKAFAGEL
jgi:type I restriction enzyme, S subunit